METDQFSDVKSVILEPLKFKSKLSIGEDAYGTLRIANRVQEYWDTYGWATTGAAAAKSTVVATTFFAPQGLLGLIGLGTAVTPVGWVVAAAVLSGGVAIGVRRFYSDASGSRVTVIPKFINTPIDVLAINLFDLIAPLALKVAAVDGTVTDDERKWIKDYFINDWGYDPLFLDAGCVLIESNLEEFSIRDVADKLAEFSKANQDCNYAAMTRDLMEFLNGVMEADGKIDEREEFALEKIEGIFKEAGRTFSKASVVKFGGDVIDSLKKGKASLESGAVALGEAASKRSDAIVKSDAFDRVVNGADNAKEFAKKSASDAIRSGKAILGKVFR